jgi:HTH-type transcriptional regulator/antitoxin HigA
MKEQYEFALARIEELLPLVGNDTPANDKSAIELGLISDIVWEYEEEHFPIEKPTVSGLIALSLQLCQKLDIPPAAMMQI